MNADPLESADTANLESAEAAGLKARRALDAGIDAARAFFRQGAERFETQARAYSANPTQTLDEAQHFIVERVKERPVTAAFAGLGVGFLLGLLLSSRGR